jgi:hypothetical protein
MNIHSHTKNQVNISNHSEKKGMTTKYLAKIQSPTAVSWPKIIQPERISKLYEYIIMSYRSSLDFVPVQ